MYDVYLRSLLCWLSIDVVDTIIPYNLNLSDKTYSLLTMSVTNIIVRINYNTIQLEHVIPIYSLIALFIPARLPRRYNTHIIQNINYGKCFRIVPPETAGYRAGGPRYCGYIYMPLLYFTMRSSANCETSIWYYCRPTLIINCYWLPRLMVH